MSALTMYFDFFKFMPHEERIEICKRIFSDLSESECQGMAYGCVTDISVYRVDFPNYDDGLEFFMRYDGVLTPTSALIEYWSKQDWALVERNSDGRLMPRFLYPHGA